MTLSWVAVGPASCPSESRRILDEVADVSCNDALRNAQLFRAFRIFRALRLVTRIKTMKDLIVGKQISKACGLEMFALFLSDETTHDTSCYAIYFSFLQSCSDFCGNASNVGHFLDALVDFLHIRGHVYAALF